MKILLPFALAFKCWILNPLISSGQGGPQIKFNLQSQIPANCTAITMTMIHDSRPLNYLYVANKEAGLKIYDLSDPKKPGLVSTVSTKLFHSLDVMNLSQDGNFIYLAIGNHFSKKQEPGMAVIDVTDPVKPIVIGYWFLPSSSGGAGIVKTEGNYAFLGAMSNGLIILNISDKKNIRLVSQFIPEINYPDPKPKKSLYNARGMEIKADLLYLCYDAGGLRIISIKDITHPVEVGRYSNPVMHEKPRAYNNIVIEDSLAFITADYCGMEVLNIKTPSKIKPVGWWNPYGCPMNNWFNSPVHANEIQYNKVCKLLFISTGKSDLDVIDVRDPAHPVLCREYGGAGNNVGTWGVGVWKDQVYLSYICSIIPFPSNWTGIKILTWEGCN